MFKKTNPMTSALPLSLRKGDATFIGWQSTQHGECYALYNVTVAGHPLAGSTVTERTLRKLELQIPQTPPRPATAL